MFQKYTLLSQHSEQVTYIFLLSLTLANLTISLGVMPLSIASLLAGEWVFGETMCIVNVSIAYNSIGIVICCSKTIETSKSDIVK